MAKKQTNKSTNGTGKPQDFADGSYFLSLTVQNVRCFGEEPQKLDLTTKANTPARWTILLGENGTGKTTLLQALASLEPIARDLGDEKRIRIPRGSRSVYYSRFQRTLTSVFQIKGYLIDGGMLSDCSYSPTLKRKKRTYLTGVDGVIRSSSSGPPYASEELDPVSKLRCYAYGASRRLSESTLKPSDNDDPAASLFNDDANLRNPEEWLLQLDYAVSKSKKGEMRERLEQRLERIKNLLVDLLPDVDAIRISNPSEEKPNPKVEFQTPYGWVGLWQLGHGYRTLIAWMVDFASRLVDRYPDHPNPLAAPAVALIDEIDLHLHPTWQRTLMSRLGELFPNTQFIVTAHSPLIVQAAGDDANLALLRREGDHVVIDNDVDQIRGWRIDQLLTSDLFGLPSARPPQYDELFRKQQEILTKAKLTKNDEAELKIIEKQLGNIPVGDSFQEAKALRTIQETLEMLQTQLDSAK